MPFIRQTPSLRSIAMGAYCALLLAGCAHRGSIEVLESELRKQEQAQEELADQLARAHEDLKVARSDASALRAKMSAHHQVAMSPEQADVFFRAEAIKFNMLLTSGQDRDGRPGDDALSVLLVPVDSHGDLVKLAGEVELELFDMTRAADRQRLGQWIFTIDEVREHWHKGFLSAGYLFQVDWQTPPSASELTLHARMTISDGRQFDTTTQVKVSPPGAASTPIARVSHESPARPAVVRPAVNGAGRAPAIGKAKVRLAASPEPNDEPASPPAPPRIRPQQGPGHAAPPIQTSDNWTEETIPRLR